MSNLSQLYRKIEIQKRERTIRNPFISYEEASQHAQRLNFDTVKQWRDYSVSGLRPKNIPSNPDKQYKKEWISWKHFLGKENCSYKMAQEIAAKENILTVFEWKEFCKTDKKPRNLPINPKTAYKKEWIDWDHFLNVLNTGKKEFISYQESSQYAKKQNIRSSTEGFEHCRNKEKPANIPCNPAITYKGKGWNGWREFLGTDRL